MRFLYLSFALVFILFHVVAGQHGCELVGGTCQFPATTNCTNGEITGVSCGSNGTCCLGGQELGPSNGNSTHCGDSNDDLPDGKPMMTDLPPLCRVFGGYCQAPRTVNCPFGENRLAFCGPNARCCRR
ncbi:uncharacterized protein LOC144327142 [Podarcis muralis]